LWLSLSTIFSNFLVFHTVLIDVGTTETRLLSQTKKRCVVYQALPLLPQQHHLGSYQMDGSHHHPKHLLLFVVNNRVDVSVGWDVHWPMDGV
jgi:hypothetical protein